MNLNVFKKRLRTLYSSWMKQKRDIWGDSDVLLICTSASDSSFHPISSAFYQWLLGYNFSDTIAIFMRKEIHFVSTKNKIPLLRTLISSAMQAIGALLIIHEKANGDDGCNLLLNEILRNSSIRCRLRPPFSPISSDENRPIIIGHVEGESPMQKLQSIWSSTNPNNGFESVIISDGLSRLCTVGAIEGHKDGKVNWSFMDSINEKKGFKMDSSSRGVYLYMRSIPKLIEEKILLAEVTSLCGEDSRVKDFEAKVEGNVKDESKRSFNEIDEWILL